MALIIYVANILYERDMITIGKISSFFFYMLVLLFNFFMMAYVVTNVMTMLGQSDKINTIMKEVPKINTSGGLKIENSDEVRGNIELIDVKFTYPTK
jgi:ABC-type multidrug transport system fused ATPase/permease subunit